MSSIEKFAEKLGIKEEDFEPIDFKKVYEKRIEELENQIKELKGAN